MTPDEWMDLAERSAKRYREQQEKEALEFICGVPLDDEALRWLSGPYPCKELMRRPGELANKITVAAKTVVDHLGEDVSMKRAIALAATEEVSKEEIVEYLLVRGLAALAGDNP